MNIYWDIPNLRLLSSASSIQLIEATNYSRAVLNWEFKFVD